MPHKTPASSEGAIPPPAIPPDWPKELAAHLFLYGNPGSGPFYCIAHSGLLKLASLLGCPPGQAMIFCLERGVWPLRFRHNRGFFSAQQQARLLASRATLVGCGGLGGYVALFLARSGLGSLRLCDYDFFEESNLNRQAFCREDRIGMNKALAGQEELRLVASHMEVEVRTEKADAATLPDMLAGSHIALDCLDDLASRRLLEHASHAAGIPFVHGAIAGAEAFALASFPGGEAVASLYGEADIPKSASAEYRLGVPTPTPVASALMQTLLALRILGGIGHEPGNMLWHMDLAVPELEILRY